MNHDDQKQEDPKSRLLLYMIFTGLMETSAGAWLAFIDLRVGWLPLLTGLSFFAFSYERSRNFSIASEIMQNGRSMDFITLDALKQRMKPKMLYLGEGFLWEKEEAEKLREIRDKRSSSIKTSRLAGRRGSPYMQTVNPEKPVYIPLSFLDGHLLITGTTGAGKTRLFDLIISQALLRGESVIIIDPKGDRELADHARAAADTVKPGCFLFFHPGFPEKSISIDPMHSFSRSTELAGRLAALVPTAHGSSDPFRAFAELALNTVIGGIMLIGKRPVLKTIRYYIDSRVMELCFLAFRTWFDTYTRTKDREEWEVLAKSVSKVPGRLLAKYGQFYLRCIKPHHPSQSLEALYSLSRHDPTHYGKMTASLMPILDILTQGELGSLLSPEDNMHDFKKSWDFQRIISRGRAVYIGLDSLTDASAGSALGSLLLADLAAVAGSRYNYGRDLQPVNIFVDETAEAVNDQLIQLLNKGRGAGFRLALATQTTADFAARLGSKDKADQILGNINNLISLRVIDRSTREYIADSLPAVRIKYRTSGSSRSHSSDSIFTLNSGITESVSEQEEAVFPADMLSELPDLEYIARVGGATVYKGRLPFLTEKTAN